MRCSTLPSVDPFLIPARLPRRAHDGSPVIAGLLSLAYFSLVDSYEPSSTIPSSMPWAQLAQRGAKLSQVPESTELKPGEFGSLSTLFHHLEGASAPISTQYL